MDEEEDLIFTDCAGKKINVCDTFDILVEDDKTVDEFNNVTLKKFIDCENKYKESVITNLSSTV